MTLLYGEDTAVTLVNLTPHPIRIYDDSLRTFVGGEYLEIPPSGQVARVGQNDLGPDSRGVDYDGLPIRVAMIEYGYAVGLPEKQPGVRFLVSLVLALANPDRDDLLVPFEEVRNEAGVMIGCKRLARPV